MRIGKVVREVIVEPRSLTEELVSASDPVVDASPSSNRRSAAPASSPANPSIDALVTQPSP